MAWGSKTSATQLTSITTEQFFSTIMVATDELDIFHCQVDVDFPATPTDHAVVSVYATLDDATQNWDDTALMQFQVDKGTDPNAVSFVVSGVYSFRVGVKRSGTTDTITSADFSYKKGT